LDYRPISVRPVDCVRCRPANDGHTVVRSTRIDRTVNKTVQGEIPPPVDYTAATAISKRKALNGCDESINAQELVCFVAVHRALLLRFHDTCYVALSHGEW
jgi:hypothetical protein